MKKPISIFSFILIIILTGIGCGSSTSKNVQEQTAAATNTKLSEIDFRKDYSVQNSEFGTLTTVVLSNGQRIMTTNALPNHATGKFPNPGNPNTIAAQDKKYSFPIQPTLSGDSRWAKEPEMLVPTKTPNKGWIRF